MQLMLPANVHATDVACCGVLVCMPPVAHVADAVRWVCS